MPIPIWTLQDRIRKAREQAGFKQDELAQLLGTTRQTLGRWENGSHVPTKKALKLLAKATDVPLSWLLDDEPSPRSYRTDGLPPQRLVLEWQGSSYTVAPQEK